jgi:magnesium dechelatase
MSKLNPQKLHVQFSEGMQDPSKIVPRCYTLTHSDCTGDLFLTVARAYDRGQISGWYTKLMRDEVVGEWQVGESPSLHLHCHVSGGLVLGPARWRDAIFRQHLPLVLDAICFGDRSYLSANPTLHEAAILVHFHAKQAALNRVEQLDLVRNHLPALV